MKQLILIILLIIPLFHQAQGFFTKEQVKIIQILINNDFPGDII